MLGLKYLPYEVLATVIDYINLEDVLSLGLCCKALSFILLEERICKVILQNKIYYSAEALEARKVSGNHATALRRALKRRDALSNANPFTVATIGFADAYSYRKGVLCYTIDQTIRVLNLHRSNQDEIVISIPLLLAQILPDTSDCVKGVFQVLYYSEGLISCLYKTHGVSPTAWLIAFGIKSGSPTVVHELDSTDKIFVRNDRQYLYYGTHSEVGTDGYKKWVIHGYDLRQKQWFDYNMHLPEMVGSEIDSTICFEFYDGYFYAVSNQTSFEVEEIDWTSFYHCIRFPLASPCEELLEKTENHSMWRRQHQEGPIDDRWTSLKLDVNEETGEMKIIESRKEWALGSSRSQRTYYTTSIIFRIHSKDEDEDYNLQATVSLDVDSSFSASSSASTSFSSSSASTLASSTSSTTATTTISSSSTPATTTLAGKLAHDLSILPNDPLTKLLMPDDNPHHMVPPIRKARETHPGNDGSTRPATPLSRCRIRSYHTSASTFLDLVDDPRPEDWQGTQRLRLRAGSRKLRPPLVDSDSQLLRGPSEDLQIALDELYRNQDIQFWPAPQIPLHENPDLDAVYNLLNPPSHLGYVEGTADERSMVYVTGDPDKPQAIIFVGFDPGIKLAGVKRWGGMSQKGVGEGPHINGRASGCCAKPGERGGGCEDVVDADRALGLDRKGKGRDTDASAVGGRTIVEVDTGVGRRGVKPWAWREKAMYLQIGLGFNFGREKRA